jgi:hypothetical protein
MNTQANDGLNLGWIGSCGSGGGRRCSRVREDTPPPLPMYYIHYSYETLQMVHTVLQPAPHHHINTLD